MATKRRKTRKRVVRKRKKHSKRKSSQLSMWKKIKGGLKSKITRFLLVISLISAFFPGAYAWGQSYIEMAIGYMKPYASKHIDQFIAESPEVVATGAHWVSDKWEIIASSAALGQLIRPKSSNQIRSKGANSKKVDEVSNPFFR